ncbi:MAG: substrate-binding domain-containing protein [Kiritimatiellia bacterium]|nr:substrate-binding domain-containing protein [Lentisphaerota bacterium]
MTARHAMLALAPLVALAAIAGLVLRLLSYDRPLSGDAPEGLIIYCDDAVAAPLDGMGQEHLGGGLLDFFRRRSGLQVKIISGESTDLLARLSSGASADLFIAEDGSFIREAGAAGLVRASLPLVRLMPVIMSRPGLPRTPEGVADLAHADLRLGLAAANSGLGRLTRDLFRAHGVDPGALRNILVTTGTAQELARAVEFGELDAAVVWAPVALFERRMAEITSIAPEDAFSSTVSLAVLNSSANPAAARQLADFLAGPVGQAHFLRMGYAAALETE